MKKFNVRVYGLLMNEHGQILVSDEQRNDFQFTKFPGGGLEFGEGITDCLKREFREELNCDIEVGQLFYLTDYFQESAFNPNDQLISIYYLVTTQSPENIKVNDTKIFKEGYENHRWLKIADLSPEEMTFPIDKLISEKIKEN